MAARADLNGESSSVTTNNSVTMIHRCIPVMVIASTSTALATSHVIMTSLRGIRSANPDSATPPTTQGRNVTA